MIFFLLADKRSTHFTYIKIGRIAARYKSELPTGRLMIGCKCVLPCVIISFHKTFCYRPTLLFMQDHAHTSEVFIIYSLCQKKVRKNYLKSPIGKIKQRTKNRNRTRLLGIRFAYYTSHYDKLGVQNRRIML
jgi:hypothetical protein